MDIHDLLQKIKLKSTINRTKSSNPLIIAANQRQVRFLRDFICGEEIVHSPIICTLNQWIETQWSRFQDAGIESTDKVLINTQQEQYIWETILNKADDLPVLIDSNSIAKYIRDAYEIVQDHQIPDTELATYSDLETQYFLSSRQKFEQYLEKHGLCTSSHALHIILTSYKKNDIEKYPWACSYGFVDKTIKLERLLTASTQIHYFIDDQPPPNQCVEKIRYDSEDAEFQAAANWAKDILSRSSSSQVSIVVPNLTQVKHRIEDCFLKTFDPNYYQDNSRFDNNRYFDISAGDMLANTPVINTAIKLLGLSADNLHKNDCRHLCHSEFWGNGVDLARINLLEWVSFQTTNTLSPSQLNEAYIKIEKQFLTPTRPRIQNRPTQDDLFSSQDKITTNQTDKKTQETDLSDKLDTLETSAQKLTHFRHQLRIVRNKKDFSAWVDWYIEQLILISWPGKRTLNSYEYQAVQSFFIALDKIKCLDNVRTNDPISLSQFTHQLTLYLQQTPFHVQTAKTRLHILGLMEAAAIPFDHCWVTGMNEKQLPTPPKPNPFLPLSLQNEYQTQRSSPQREYQYAKQIIKQLHDYNTQLIFSYCNDDTQATHPSPLISHIPLKEEPDYNDSKNKRTDNNKNPIEQNYAHHIERYTDDNYDKIDLGNAPSLPQKTRLHGGSYHLGLHAKNPLYAYLHFRVGARIPPEESVGLSAMDRGILLHALLANIYSQYTDQNTLKAWLTCDTYLNQLHDIIKSTLDTFLSTYKKNTPLLIEDVEYGLLKSRVHTFLALDAQRPFFKTIGIEKEFTVEIYKRQIKLRVDRIDRLEDNSQVIIDYKSGRSSLTGLQRDPIFDCQLPLYIAATRQENTRAIAYAELSSKAIAYCGIGHITGEPIKGITLPASLTRYQLPDSWEDACLWWQDQLEHLVLQISEGHCHYCHRYPTQLIHYQYFSSLIRNEEKYYPAL